MIGTRKWAAGTIGDNEPNEILDRYFRGRPGGQERARRGLREKGGKRGVRLKPNLHQMVWGAWVSASRR